MFTEKTITSTIGAYRHTNTSAVKSTRGLGSRRVMPTPPRARPRRRSTSAIITIAVRTIASDEPNG